MGTLTPIIRGSMGKVYAIVLMSLLVAAPLFSAWVPVSSQTEGTPPQWQVLSCTPSKTVIEFTMHGYWSEDIQVGNTEYARLAVPGDHGTTQHVGLPELPTISQMVGLPPTGAVAVRMAEADYETLPTKAIYPFQTPLVDGETSQGFDRDAEAYRSSSLYPESWVTIEEPGIWRDVRISRMTVQPFRVNNADGQVQVARHMVVEVLTGLPGGTNEMSRGPHPVRPHFYKMYQAVVVNFEELGYSVMNVDEDPGIQFLVITNPECLDAIQPLVDYRHQQGFKVEVRTLTPDFDEPEEFKAYITDLYHSTGLEYVLMVGDAYYGGGPSGVDVPMYYWNPEGSNASYSDSWYTCVDPGDPMDHYAELAIGRIVYDSIAELTDQITKTMNYILEGDTIANWQENTLLVAHQEQYPLKYTQCKNQIVAFPYSIQVAHFDSVYGYWGNNQQVIDYVNTTSCGILNYRGHGSDTEWWQWGQSGSFGLSHVYQLTNYDRLFVHFDVCCDNMNIIDHPGDCFCEAMMKHLGASVAVNGAIIPSYTIPNHDYDKFMYRAVYDEGITHIGYVTNFANVEVLNGHGSMGRSNVRTYLWLGDAAIDVITYLPEPLIVDYPSGTNVGIPDIDVNVATAAAPVEGAMVCVSNDSVYSRGFTNSSGDVTITMDPAPMIGGFLEFWVTGHNLEPFHAQIEIIMGYGDLEGTVTDAATASGIEGAVVTVQGPDMSDTTDANGDYQILDVPAWTYDVLCEAEGYLPQVASVTIDSGEVATQDFDMLHAECALSITEIVESMMPEEEVVVDVTLSNNGNGPLEYTIVKDHNPLGLPNPPTDFSETLWAVDMDTMVGDQFLHSVEYAWGNYWIAGSGNGINPSLYRYDTDWNLLETIPQPVTQTLGIRDMAFDGEYLWAGDRDSIVCMDENATIMYRIPGPYNPNRALAFNDHNGNLYVVDRANDVYELDPADGTVIQTFGNDLDIMGMAFHPDRSEEGSLYLFVGGSSADTVRVYAMDVTTGEQEMVGRLSLPDNQRAGGCTITNGLDRLRWTFLGMTVGYHDYVEAYNLGWRDGWLTVAPDSGTVQGGDQDTITVTLRSMDYLEGDYLADIIVNHTAAGGSDTINVSMSVTYTGITDAGTSVPSEFRLDQAYPNPFNPSATIPFALRETTRARLVVYNVLGQQVALLVDGMVQAGEHRVLFDARNLASGVYFYRLEAGDFVQTRKMVMLK
jgi:hypothetical protein